MRPKFVSGLFPYGLFLFGAVLLLFIGQVSLAQPTFDHVRVNMTRKIEDGTLLFLPPATYSCGASRTSAVATADLNGDGYLDLAVANATPDTVGVLLGKGDGTFGEAVTYDSAGWPTAVAAGDLNGDRHPDLIVAHSWSNTVGVFLNNGDGTFRPQATYDSGGDDGESVVVADANGDGRPDVLVANWSSGTVGVLLGNGDGTFQSTLVYDTGLGGASWVAVADLNGDGKLDLVTANGCFDGWCETGGAVVALGTGDGTFQTSAVYPTGGSMANSVAVADLNKDGRLDLVVANCTPPGSGACDGIHGHGVVGVLLGNGDGTFRPVVKYDPGFPQSNVVRVADLNMDGKPDVVVSNFEYPLSVFLGKGGGSLYPPVSFSSDGSDWSLSIADVNQDHKPDLLVANWDSNVAVLLNGTDVARLKSKTALTTSGSPSPVGQPVIFTANVSSTGGTIPDGEFVTFFDGPTPLGSETLVGGLASYTTSSLAAKTHNIKATYSGDTIFLPSAGRITQLVSKYPTNTVLTSSPNPSAFGQPVTFTVVVIPSGPYALTGKVKFWDGSTAIGSALLSNNGTATITKYKLALGMHPITAQFLGDGTSDKSTSSVVNQAVQ